MDNCNTCFQIEIPQCTDQLTINGLGAATAYDIFIKDISTRQTTLFQASSDGAGILLVDTSSFTFTPAKGFELFVVTPQGEGIHDREDITINTVVYTCIGLEVCPVQTVPGVSVPFTNITLN